MPHRTRPPSSDGTFTGALGSREERPARRRELLRTLRRHPAPDVRDAALEETTAYG